MRYEPKYDPDGRPEVSVGGVDLDIFDHGNSPVLGIHLDWHNEGNGYVSLDVVIELLRRAVYQVTPPK